MNYTRCLLLLFSMMSFFSCKQEKYDITFSSLLDEMVDYEESARFPAIPFSCRQESSYDRRSVHPDSAGWFANNDGFGIIRVDTINGRKENVLFDQDGPGVITRFWLTTMDKRGIMRFYFNHAGDAQWEIPAYDLLRSGLSIGKELVQEHPNYTPDGKGGNTLFLPIPYSNGCKITFELPDSIEPSPKYYGINYRSYPIGTKVETFSVELVEQNKDKILYVDSLLRNYPSYEKGTLLTESKELFSKDSLSVALPEGTNAVRLLSINIQVDSVHYEQAMREQIIKMSFDGVETVTVPLSDFSGAGMGARKSDSWYISADGKGHVLSRWVMPYQSNAVFKLVNLSSTIVKADIEIRVDDWKWDERSLYFHSSWRQENGIHVEANPDNDAACIDWNFTTLNGRGVYKGDVLSLFNHTLAWYGEGDEKIWVDDDKDFPSHFGTGTEDYYNCSWAPVIPFYTPFGGATRADAETSIGYNTFFRTRSLDQIPFNRHLRFDIEMLSWISGEVDYAATVYWYGDLNAKAENSTLIEEATRPLLPQPADPAAYKIATNAIEFEKLTPTAKSEELFTDGQGMLTFSKGKWSGSKQLICTHGKTGSFIEYEFEVPENKPYDITVHGTKAPDYGIIGFYVNGHKSSTLFDGCSAPEYDIVNSGAIRIGRYDPENGKIRLKIELVGKNEKVHGTGGIFGLDCLILNAVK